MHPALQGANKGRRVVKTSTDEHQSAQHLAVRARLASYPVVYRKSYSIQDGRTHLGAGFPLRCFQRLSVPDIATLHVPLVRQQGDQRSVHSGPLVLGATPLNVPAPIKAARELGSERRETVRSLSATGAGTLRGVAPSTRGPE